MTAVLGRAWRWLRSWGGGRTGSQSSVTAEEPEEPERPAGGWMWARWRRRGEVEEYWEAQEKLEAVEVPDPAAESRVRVSRWWSYLWPRQAPLSGPKRRTGDGDTDGDVSDYGTPPPSPSPASSPFRLFAHSWKVEVLPEHYDICFNFLRHLFDLCVVGFLWTVSPPAKLVLEVLGVQGPLRLWFHGMAMFFVSTVGMAGLLWLVQEYLLQFALIYGVVQVLVISVSVRQRAEEEDGERGETEDVSDSKEPKQRPVSLTDEVKTN